MIVSRKAKATATIAAASAELDRCGDPHRPPDPLPVGVELGDRPRQKLLDRAEERRDDDEDHRPQHDDDAVVLGRQRVRGEGEEPVGQQAGRRERSGQHPGGEPVAARAAGLPGPPSAAVTTSRPSA